LAKQAAQDILRPMGGPKNKYGPDADGLDRRTLLGAGLGGALALPTLLQSALAATGDLTATDLGGGLTLITGAGANVVVARGPDGAVLVDGGRAEHAQAVIDLALKSAKARKVSTLFNTSWRPDYSGANELVGATGAPIVAHENTRLWMGQEIWVRWEDKVYKSRPQAARPTKTFYTTGSLALGKEKADYGYMLQAHTDGDAYVFFRKANVLVCGGAVSNAGWPLIDWATGGWIGSTGRSQTLNVIEIPTYGGMNGALQHLIELADDNTKIVPGHGPVMTKADLQAQSKMLITVADRLRDALYKGIGTREVIASQPTKEFDAKMGDPAQFTKLAFESLWGHLTPDA
jgi:glyoxylase-like metal-dependent hydrolase (beta-lactamase superfamily II)